MTAASATLAIPPGYRFVVQFVDEATEADARAWFARMVGDAKAARAMYLPGVCVRHSTAMKTLANGWHECGFRVYLPEKERTYD